MNLLWKLRKTLKEKHLPYLDPFESHPGVQLWQRSHVWPIWKENSKCNLALYSSETILTYIVNPSCMTCLKVDRTQWESLSNSPNTEGSVEINNIEPMNTPASPRHKKKTSQPKSAKIPFFMTNLSSTSRVVLPKDHIVAFITPENPETNYVEISEIQSVDDQCRNW